MRPKIGKSASRDLPPVTPLPIHRAPTIRDQRIRAARVRIASGFYERHDVQEQLVDAVLEDLQDDR
jgi:hypothetical protein